MTDDFPIGDPEASAAAFAEVRAILEPRPAPVWVWPRQANKKSLAEQYADLARVIDDLPHPKVAYGVDGDTTVRAVKYDGYITVTNESMYGPPERGRPMPPRQGTGTDDDPLVGIVHDPIPEDDEFHEDDDDYL